MTPKTLMRLLVAALLAACLCGLCGCVRTEEKEPEMTEEEMARVMEENEAAWADAEPLGPLSAAMWKTGAAMLRDTEDAGPNRMVSPLSLEEGLGLLASGSQGETRSQVEAVLGAGADETAGAFSAFEPGNTLKAADSVWIRSPYSFSQGYLDTVRSLYKAEAQSGDFGKETAQAVTEWVREKTDGMIPDFRADLDGDCVLLNACAFDGKWADPFEDGGEGDFENADGSRARVPMMDGTGDAWIEGDGCKGFAKSYIGGFSFSALLPDGDAGEFLASKTGEELAALVGGADTGPEVSVRMPPFEGDTGITLTGLLKSLGMRDAFGADADFAPMVGDGAGGFHISEVRQQTRVELDKEGTRAAAVTSSSGLFSASADSEEPERKEIVLDRPFVYFITLDPMDGNPPVPVFAGVVGEPGS